MNLTKLSLVAALALSSAVAGGEIVEVEKVIPCDKTTTISGKAVGYYLTDDTVDLFDEKSSQLGTAVTLDVAHKLFDGVTANFSAVGYVNLLEDGGYMESNEKGAFFNVANITATFGDTTLIAGRQLIDSPMFGSFDWKLAQSSFEAYTLVNKSLSNLTLVGTYVRQHRAFDAGDAWTDLTDIGDGNNYAVGAAYGTNLLSANLWYYNIDAGNYTQVYADAGYDFGVAKVEGQVASTDYAAGDDSLAYGAKASTEFSGVNVSAAVNVVTDRAAGFIDRDGLYASSWNTFASGAAAANDDTISWKVGASTELAGVSAEASYAGYGDEGSELDVILGYDVTNSINLGVVYSMTDYDVTVDATDEVNALEFFATYTF